MMNDEIILTVSDFVALINQTLEYAYPYIDVVGEVSNFRISKGKWVYFDLKDETAILRCFTTVYGLSAGPLEDGMMIKVSGSPKLHPLYNFTFNVQSVCAVGEGSLKRQADLLLAKLEAEGLFDASRKRELPRIARHIALVTAAQSAAYADFIKITGARWGGVTIDLHDVQVQGEPAAGQIVDALATIAAQSDLPEVIVIIRGGGSVEDLASFNDERVVRAVAACRVPTLVAIGHEVDISLAELAADVRASTPSNAAELLFPDKKTERQYLKNTGRQLDNLLHTCIVQSMRELLALKTSLSQSLEQLLLEANRRIAESRRLLRAFDPKRPLTLGFAIVRNAKGQVVHSGETIKPGDEVQIELTDSILSSQVKNVHKKEKYHD